jgi:hypothetical protein
VKKQRFIWLVIAWLSAFCSGQAIKIRVINGKNGRPLSKQPVSVSLLYLKSEKLPAKYDAVLHLETGLDGVAQFTLLEPAPERLSLGANLTSEHWHCVCGPALVATKELLQKGIVQGSAFSSTAIQAKAGEIVFVTRPFTFFERLLYPLEKE